jgi:hypothetical protein
MRTDFYFHDFPAIEFNPYFLSFGTYEQLISSAWALGRFFGWFYDSETALILVIPRETNLDTS